MRVGVFDSGVGGLTVLKELRSSFPFVHFLYLGDTAHVPYGTKSPAQILSLSLEWGQYLKEKQIQALVIACNTATSVALEPLKELFTPLPVFGVIEPGSQAVYKEWFIRPRPIVVFGTRTTIRSQAYSRRIKELASPKIPQVFEQECPLLSPMIEEGWLDHPVLHLTLAEYAKPYLRFPIGIALLGCTHYPWIKDAFQKCLPGWTILDSAAETALALETFLKQYASDQEGSVEWIFTDQAALPVLMEKIGEGFPFS